MVQNIGLGQGGRKRQRVPGEGPDGSGSGRVIKTVLDVLPDVKLIGVETDKNMFSFIKDRFFQDKRVEINHADIADYLSGDKQYDMALCLMNTFGNINDIKVFKKIVDHADYFVFSLYNRDFDEQRKLMYTYHLYLTTQYV